MASPKMQNPHLLVLADRESEIRVKALLQGVQLQTPTLLLGFNFPGRARRRHFHLSKRIERFVFSPRSVSFFSATLRLGIHSPRSREYVWDSPDGQRKLENRVNREENANFSPKGDFARCQRVYKSTKSCCYKSSIE